MHGLNPDYPVRIENLPFISRLTVRLAESIRGLAGIPDILHPAGRLSASKAEGYQAEIVIFLPSETSICSPLTIFKCLLLGC